jgi:hypothetical protein
MENETILYRRILNILRHGFIINFGCKQYPLKEINNKYVLPKEFKIVSSVYKQFGGQPKLFYGNTFEEICESIENHYNLNTDEIKMIEEG